MSLPEPTPGDSTSEELTYAEAMALGLREAFEEDERVFLLGKYLYGITRHQTLTDELFNAYPDRCWDPPISELGNAGTGIGASISGLRPIVDIGTASFVFQGFAQVVNEAANIYYMSGGQTSVPIVFHLIHGIRGGGGPQHSHSPQGMLWNTPGLQIVLPSSPRDVRGMIHSAIESENPVVWIDHNKLFDIRGDVPLVRESLPFGVAEVRRPGTDVTLVATSYMVHRTLAVADALAAQGVSAEVIDPRTLVPFDLEGLLNSVAKTGRLVVVDEGHQSCGVAAEIAALVVEHGFDLLRAPIRRVTALDVPVPFSPSLESFVKPTDERISMAALATLGIRSESMSAEGDTA